MPEIVGGRDEDEKLKGILARISSITDRHDKDAITAALVDVSNAGLCPVHLEQALGAVKDLAKVPMSAVKRQMREAVSEQRKSEREIGGRKTSWRDGLTLNAFGTPYRNEGNALKVLERAPEFAGRLYADEFTGRPMIDKPLPWSRDVRREWVDVDDTRFVEWLTDNADLDVSVGTVRNAVLAAAFRRIRNPVKEYLSGLKWDGVGRLDRWLSYYLGAEHSDVTAHIGAKWMISAVARAMDPGCKADHMLVLEGPQGIRKSTALRVLAGDEHFTDDISDISSKDSLMQMSKFWVIELAEMEAFRGRDASKVRAFLTRQVDTFRPPYGRSTIDVARHCVFAGTVNTDTWIQSDGTGARRFWPVKCSSIDVDGIKVDRGQLWAEAISRYRAGERWYIEAGEVLSAVEKEQSNRELPDEWAAIFDKWVARDEYGLNGRDDTSIGEFLTEGLGIKPGDYDRRSEMRVASILKGAGWIRYYASDHGKRTWRYRRPDGEC